jgi:hypothetical protein
MSLAAQPLPECLRIDQLQTANHAHAPDEVMIGGEGGKRVASIVLLIGDGENPGQLPTAGHDRRSA